MTDTPSMPTEISAEAALVRDCLREAIAVVSTVPLYVDGDSRTGYVDKGRLLGAVLQAVVAVRMANLRAAR